MTNCQYPGECGEDEYSICPTCAIVTRATLAAVTAERDDLKRDLEGARHANDAERGAWSRAWAILTGESEYGAHSDEAIVRAARAVSAERDELSRRLKVAMAALGDTVRYWPADVAARVLDAIEGTSK